MLHYRVDIHSDKKEPVTGMFRASSYDGRTYKIKGADSPLKVVFYHNNHIVGELELKIKS